MPYYNLTKSVTSKRELTFIEGLLQIDILEIRLRNEFQYCMLNREGEIVYPSLLSLHIRNAYPSNRNKENVAWHLRNI